MSDSGMTPPPPPPSSPAGPYGGGYGGASVPHPQGTTILVLGILSLVCCGPLGIAAWIMGNKANLEIQQNPSAFSNAGTVNAGKICGIIGVALTVLGLVVFFLFGGLAALTAGSTGVTP